MPSINPSKIFFKFKNFNFLIIKGKIRIVAIKNLIKIKTEKEEYFVPSFTVTKVNPHSNVVNKSIKSAKKVLSFINFI